MVLQGFEDKIHGCMLRHNSIWMKSIWSPSKPQYGNDSNGLFGPWKMPNFVAYEFKVSFTGPLHQHLLVVGDQSQVYGVVKWTNIVVSCLAASMNPCFSILSVIQASLTFQFPLFCSSSMASARCPQTVYICQKQKPAYSIWRGPGIHKRKWMMRICSVSLVGKWTKLDSTWKKSKTYVQGLNPGGASGEPIKQKLSWCTPSHPWGGTCSYLSGWELNPACAAQYANRELGICSVAGPISPWLFVYVNESVSAKYMLPQKSVVYILNWKPEAVVVFV